MNFYIYNLKDKNPDQILLAASFTKRCSKFPHSQGKIRGEKILINMLQIDKFATSN